MSEQLETTRRTALRMAGATAAVAGVAGCAATTTATPPAASTGAASGASGSTGLVVPAGTVPVGGGAVVNQSIVVTQPTAGTYKAFSAICTHQGCPVNAVRDGAIVCPCHNSKFDITTGAVLAGPAPSPLPSLTVTLEKDGLHVS